MKRINLSVGLVIFTSLGLLSLAGCPKPESQSPRNAGFTGELPVVVCTTGMLGDAVRQIGGEHVEVHALMGPGVDPHLYKARPSDMEQLARADLIVYHGLHLEAKLADVLEQMGKTRNVLAAAELAIPAADLLTPNGGGGMHDPHVWFDVSLWKPVCARIGEELGALDPARSAEYARRTSDYLATLDTLDQYVSQQAATVPEDKRVLVTAHDAFGYFGRKYGFTVVGLQGISTEAEAGTGDVQRLTDFIVERKLPAIFVESSVPVRNIEALLAAAEARGHTVRNGGELFSDALGADGTPAGTYDGMVRHNIDTIVAALGGASE